jgi:xylan 1,4-beta-xylosidase
MSMIRVKILFSISIALLGGFTMAFAQQPSATFTEPVITGFYPDPSICRVKDDYYTVHSSFEYFPGVPIFHSRDLVHWKQIGYCLSRPSQLKLGNIRSSGGIYAPTIRYNKGTFYMVTTLIDGGGNFYVTAKNPAGPWSEPVWLDQGDMDPSLFFDDDGKVYYTRHVGGGDGYIGQTTLDLKTGKLEGPLQEIWRGTGGIWAEGPHLYKINKKYYLMIAEGGTSFDHRVTVARADTPFGPFTSNPDNPILTHRGQNDRPFQALGHADLVETPAGWWAVCLGIRPVSGNHHLGRETFLVPVTWTRDGWPVMGNKGTIDPVMTAPQLKSVPWPAEKSRDEFDAKTFGLKWNWLRNPNEADYSLTEQPGFLRLKGSAVTMNDIASPTFIGQRQTDLTCRAAARLSFNPARENEEAGLVLRGNERSHYEIGIVFLQGKRQIVFRKTMGNKVNEIKYFDAPGTEDVILSVEAAPTEYKLSFQLAGGQPVPAGTGRTRNLSSETIGGFTGVFIGLYATGAGQPASIPADFDWFEYQGLDR